MTTLQIPLRTPFNFTQERAVALAHLLSRYDASVMIHDRNRTVNGKSLLGILSLGYIEADTLEFLIDGVEEDRIGEVLTEFFSGLDV